ncbi:MAG: lipopolysaccharide heptosyltransferase II [Halothermotrichaceae bacterium]
MNSKLLQAKKIIILDLLYLGDLIFATPFFRNLRNNVPNARIDIIVNSNFSEILEGNPYLDNIISYNKKYKTMESIHFARNVAKNRYDLGLNIHGNWRTALLMRLINPDYSIGFGGKGRGIFLNEEFIPPKNTHMVDIYLKFLNSLGISEIDNYGLELNVEKKAEESIDKFLNDQGVEKEDILVGLNTGGSYRTKKWPIRKFAKLADIIQLDYNKKVVFFGGTVDVERVYEIVGIMRTEPIVAAGKTSLKELSALAKRCSLLITGDTGPLHVTASVGTPTIALFGPTDEEMFYPYGKGHQVIVVEDLDCRPCGEHNCPLGHHKCLEDIHVEHVLKKAEKYL